LILTGVALALAGAPGCRGDDARSQAKEAKEVAKEVRTETEEALKDVQKETEEAKQDFTRKAQRDVEELDRKIVDLEKRTSQYAGAARTEVDTAMSELRAARVDLESGLAKLRTEAGDAWGAARTAVERALERLRRAEIAAGSALGGPAANDATLASKVKARILAEEATRTAPITVEVREGVTTLKGNVLTEATRARVIELARGTEGVKSVVDELTIAARPAVP
jgi:osmotically-inducible protein OsmY